MLSYTDLKGKQTVVSREQYDLLQERTHDYLLAVTRYRFKHPEHRESAHTAGRDLAKLIEELLGFPQGKLQADMESTLTRAEDPQDKQAHLDVAYWVAFPQIFVRAEPAGPERDV